MLLSGRLLVVGQRLLHGAGPAALTSAISVAEWIFVAAFLVYDAGLLSWTLGLNYFFSSRLGYPLFGKLRVAAWPRSSRCRSSGITGSDSGQLAGKVNTGVGKVVQTAEGISRELIPAADANGAQPDSAALGQPVHGPRRARRAGCVSGCPLSKTAGARPTAAAAIRTTTGITACSPSASSRCGRWCSSASSNACWEFTARCSSAIEAGRASRKRASAIHYAWRAQHAALRHQADLPGYLALPVPAQRHSTPRW